MLLPVLPCGGLSSILHSSDAYSARPHLAQAALLSSTDYSRDLRNTWRVICLRCASALVSKSAEEVAQSITVSLLKPQDCQHLHTTAGFRSSLPEGLHPVSVTEGAGSFSNREQASTSERSAHVRSQGLSVGKAHTPHTHSSRAAPPRH